MNTKYNSTKLLYGLTHYFSSIITLEHALKYLRANENTLYNYLLKDNLKLCLYGLREMHLYTTKI